MRRGQPQERGLPWKEASDVWEGSLGEFYLLSTFLYKDMIYRVG